MRVALASLVFAAVACSSYGENSGSAPPSTPSDAGAIDADSSSSVGDAAPTVDASADGGTTFCAQNAGKKLCDDFEDGELLGPPWNRLNAGFAPREAMTIVNVGGNALARVAVPVVPMGEHAWCMLEHEVSPVPAKMTFALTAKTAGFVAGDYVEVATIYEKASSRAVALFFDQGRMYIAGSGLVATDVGDATRWTRYTVTMAGTRFTVKDEAGTLRADVTITGSAYADAVVVGVGLTYSDQATAGTIDVDDVIVDY